MVRHAQIPARILTLWSLALAILLAAWPVQAADRWFTPQRPHLFVTVDLPTEGQLGMVGLADINDQGDVVGNKNFGSNGGFILQAGGTVMELQCPGSTHWETRAHAINRWGEVAGTCAINGQDHGYVYHPSRPHQPYTFVTIPGATQVSALGLNDTGGVVGEYLDAESVFTHGFLWGEWGAFWRIDAPFPGVQATGFNAVNNGGALAGYYVDAAGALHGLVYYWGLAWTHDVPGARWTVITDINEAWEVVGWTREQDDTGQSWLYSLGQFYDVGQVPGILEPASGIGGLNNRRQLAGHLTLRNPGGVEEFLSRGFVASPLPGSTSNPLALAQTRSLSTTAGTRITPGPPRDWTTLPRKGQILLPR